MNSEQNNQSRSDIPINQAQNSDLNHDNMNSIILNSFQEESLAFGDGLPKAYSASFSVAHADPTENKAASKPDLTHQDDQPQSKSGFDLNQYSDGVTQSSKPKPTSHSVILTHLIDTSKEFPFEQCIILGVEGKGGFGVVFLISDMMTEIDYILKIDSKASVNNNIEREIYSLLKQKKHPNLMGLTCSGVIGVKPEFNIYLPRDGLMQGLNMHSEDRRECPFFVLEQGVCSLQDLIDYRKDNNIIWTEDEIHHLLVSMIRALSHLKELGIVHRDIKPDNIIIVIKDSEVTWKLADFGVSIILPNGEESIISEKVGTIGYMAPELSKSSSSGKVNPFLTDIYSLGITLQHCKTQGQSKGIKQNDKFDFNILLEKMTSQNPENRATIEKLLAYVNDAALISNKAATVVKERIEKDAFWSRERKFKKKTESTSGGDQFAQFTIGFMYEHGTGVQKNIPEAQKWYEMASKQGNLIAQQRLADLYILGAAELQVDYSKAKTLFEQIQSQKTPVGHLRTASSYGNLGSLYYSYGDYQKSIEYYLKAIEFQIDIVGDKQGPVLAVTYNNLGAVYLNSGDYEKAKECCLKVIETRKADLGDYHPEMAIAYNNLGLIYSKSGEIAKTKEYFLKALEIQTASSGEKNKRFLAKLYNNLGYACSFSLGGVNPDAAEYQKAREYYLKALEIQKEVSGEFHPITAEMYINLGNMNTNFGEFDGEFENAPGYYLRAIQIQKSILGENHPDIAVTFHCLGSMYTKSNDHEKATEYLLKALEIRIATFGENHESTATTYNNLGYLYFHHLKDYKKAKDYYHKALAIQNVLFGEFYPNSVKTCNNLAEVYDQCGDDITAQEYVLKGLEIQMEALGDSHPDAAISCQMLADAYSDCGQEKKAQKYYLRALEIQKAAINGSLKLSTEIPNLPESSTVWHSTSVEVGNEERLALMFHGSEEHYQLKAEYQDAVIKLSNDSSNAKVELSDHPMFKDYKSHHDLKAEYQEYQKTVMNPSNSEPSSYQTKVQFSIHQMFHSYKGHNELKAEYQKHQKALIKPLDSEPSPYEIQDSGYAEFTFDAA